MNIDKTLLGHINQICQRTAAIDNIWGKVCTYDATCHVFDKRLNVVQRVMNMNIVSQNSVVRERLIESPHTHTHCVQEM